MASCYQCGQLIASSSPRFRRKVKTGEWVRNRVAKQKVVTSQASFGWRIVCQACARRIDFEQVRKEVEWLIKLGIALVVLYLVVVFRDSL